MKDRDLPHSAVISAKPQYKIYSTKSCNKRRHATAHWLQKVPQYTDTVW